MKCATTKDVKQLHQTATCGHAMSGRHSVADCNVNAAGVFTIYLLLGSQNCSTQLQQTAHKAWQMNMKLSNRAGINVHTSSTLQHETSTDILKLAAVFTIYLLLLGSQNCTTQLQQTVHTKPSN
jgi:hypothetical protein